MEPGCSLLNECGLIFHQSLDTMIPMTTGMKTLEMALQEFRSTAKDEIVGQDAAIDDTRSDHRPLGVVLLAGPDRGGTKADLVKMLAERSQGPATLV
jgi:ATP-dependent Clp protease ATP-binding subunit ClpA